MPSQLPLPLILFAGASARWACEAARDAGYRCLSADLFSDRDTRAAAESSWLISDYSELTNLVSQAKIEGMVILGGMENQCQLVAQLAQFTNVLGCPAETLEKCLNPGFLKEVFGHQFPETKDQHFGKSPGRWLEKPVCSAGGHHVVFIPEGRDVPRQAGVIVQEFVVGETIGAVFIADENDVCLLGATQQVTGFPFHTSPFVYCGSIGPLHLPWERFLQIEELGHRLFAKSKLCGLFGLDIVIGDAYSGLPRVVDVNLRPTSSCEILQMGLGKKLDLMKAHLSVGFGEPLANLAIPGWQEPVTATVFGKAIVYNGSSDWVFDAERFARLTEQLPYPKEGVPRMADVPQEGALIQARHPILTILESGADCGDVRERLVRARQAILSVVDQ